MMFALAGSLPARQRHVLAGTFAAMAAVILAAATHTLFGVGGSRLDAPTENWASCAVYVLVAGIVVFRAFRIAEARAALQLAREAAALGAAIVEELHAPHRHPDGVGVVPVRLERPPGEERLDALDPGRARADPDRVAPGPHDRSRRPVWMADSVAGTPPV